MNIIQLQYVLEVQKTGSISQAANNLYMNQPNLSKSIRELEESLGIIIFHRTPQGVTPTTKGKEFLNYAREIVQKSEELVQFCQQDFHDTLSVTAPHASYLSASFVAVLQKAMEDSPSISAKYEELSSAETISNVLSGETSLGIVRFPEKQRSRVMKSFTQDKLTFIPLFKFTPKLTLSTANPLVLEETITKDMLKDHTEIIINQQSLDFSPTPPPSDSKTRLQVLDRCNQYLMLQEIPKTYLWASPISRREMQRHNITQREIPGAHEQFFDVLIYLQGRSLSPIENNLVKDIQKTITTLSQF